jgi:hypothetical protein
MPETIAPSAAAPSAAPPSTPSPAPAPSAPAATTPTPSPAPAPSTSPFSEGPSIEDKLTSAITSAREAVTKESGEPAAAPPAEVKPAEEAKPEAAAEPKVEEAKPAEAAEAKPAEAESTEELVLDETDLTPPLFAQELKKDPQAQKFFDDHPDLKRQVFAALRRDTENRELRAIVPTIAAAKEMQRGATLYTDFDNTFLDARDPANSQKFVERLGQEALLLDDKGQIITNADGSYKLDPAFINILNHIHRTQANYHVDDFKKTGQISEVLQQSVTAVLDAFASKAKLSGDERTLEAAAILKEALSPNSSAQEEMTDAQKAREASLKAQEAEIQKSRDADRQRQSEEAKVANTRSIDKADETATSALKGQLQPAIRQSGMTTAETELFHQKVGAALDEKLSQNAWFKNQERAILREPPGEAREKKHTALILEYAQQYLADIAKTKMREVLGGTLKRQAERQDKIDAQKSVSATEPRGTSITMGAPQGKTSNAQLIAEYKASHNGEEPSMEWVMTEAIKRAAAQPAA